jgi:hypothetical protein
MKNRHGSAPFFTGGRARVFRIVKINENSVDRSRNSATESIPAAVTPKLTMIAGQQLSIGALPV